jgi:hypothetical protein
VPWLRRLPSRLRVPRLRRLPSRLRRLRRLRLRQLLVWRLRRLRRLWRRLLVLARWSVGLVLLTYLPSVSELGLTIFF